MTAKALADLAICNGIADQLDEGLTALEQIADDMAENFEQFVQRLKEAKRGAA